MVLSQKTNMVIQASTGCPFRLRSILVLYKPTASGRASRKASSVSGRILKVLREPQNIGQGMTSIAVNITIQK